MSQSKSRWFRRSSRSLPLRVLTSAASAKGVGHASAKGKTWPNSRTSIRPIAMRFQTCTFIVGGKIVEGWNSFDQLGMLQQLGVVPLG